jgi:cation transport ATPase
MCIAIALEEKSEHPLAEAIVQRGKEHISQEVVPPCSVALFQAIP